MNDLRTRLQAVLGGAYTIERELGRGGMATVFLAQDLKHKRPVAIKVLAPEIARSVGPQRFLREIEIAARLTHPHILPVFDSGEGDGLLYYVMPYVRGESLRQRLQREARLPVEEAVRIGREVADALDYAHRHGIVHRDIKPENVLLEEGHAIVADFGVARALAGEGGGPALTDVGLAIGTPYYMSPEQAMGEGSIDGRADLYALGCVLYEMLAGQPVFEGPTAQAVARQHPLETPRRLHVVRPEVPEAIERVANRALAKSPAERWTTGAEMGAALLSGEVPALPGARRSRRLRIALTVAGAIVLAAIGLLVVRGRTPAVLDSNLVAVAPFDVLVPELRLWSEGLVDVLSRDLDGAGPLRTVAPTVVVRRWGGRADAPSAAALGRRTGARLAVFGQVLGVGGDTVRLSATLYDVTAGRALGEFQLRDVSERMDRVADSLTVALLRELGRTRPIGAVRLASLRSTSLPALKAFLQGEQFYRRTDWDSAIAYYDRALALDSSFTLALRRVGTALGWQRAGIDAKSRELPLRAGALNRGLAPRDSLLVAADSLSAVLFTGPEDALWYPHARRLFATLAEATRRYPDDPEVWYALGDARFHFGDAPGLGGSKELTLTAFDRAIALDSAFGPSYIHPVDLALNLGGPDRARRYILPYLALDPKDINARGIRLVARLIDPGQARASETRRQIDTLPVQVLVHAIAGGLGRWPDTAETGLRLARARLATPRQGDSSHPAAATLSMFARGLLSYRGHWREAGELVEDPAQAGGLFLYRTLFGAIPPDSADRTFARWAESRSPAAMSAAPWWAVRGDTVSLRVYVQIVEAMSRRPPQPFLAGMLRYQLEVGRVYLALGRRDTTEALRLLLALPDSLCQWCLLPVLQRAQLLAARGRDREAAPLLDREVLQFWDPAVVLLALERGRVNERLGNRDKALDAYQFVADAWAHADPELQRHVEEAKAALQRLGGEPRR
jgi:serine/threonine-protein kinase